MGVAPVERPVASAAYSFVRFCGGAIGPYVALKLFGLAAGRPRARAVLVRRGDGGVGVVILAGGCARADPRAGGPPRDRRSTRPRRSWSATSTEDVPTRRQPWRHDRKERRSPLAGKASAMLHASGGETERGRTGARPARAPSARRRTRCPPGRPSYDPSRSRRGRSIAGRGNGGGQRSSSRGSPTRAGDPGATRSWRSSLRHGDEEEPGAVEGVRRRHHDLGVVVVVDVPAGDSRPEGGEARASAQSKVMLWIRTLIPPPSSHPGRRATTNARRGYAAARPHGVRSAACPATTAVSSSTPSPRAGCARTAT